MTTSAAAVLDRIIAQRDDDEDVCLHCGDRCGAGSLRTAAGPFCCGGCESVFSLLAAHGLTAFYTCDPAAGASQKSAPPRDADVYAALDDPIVARRLIAPVRDGVVRVTFATPALHCASCVWLLEQLWRFDSGIVRSETHLLHRRIIVEFLPQVTSLRAVAARLASLGYPPVIDAEADPGVVPRARRRLYVQLGVAGFAFGNVMLFSIPAYVNGGPLEPEFQRLFAGLNLLFSLPVLLVSAADYFRGAWAGMRARTMTLDVPIAIGLAVLYGRSVFDIAAGRGEGFLDSFAGLVFFLLIGRLFQQKAFDSLGFDRTARSFVPLSVQVERRGLLALTPVDDLRPGDVMLLRPQEVVPADAVVSDQEGAIDYAFVTGEQAPVAVRRGDRVEAGGRVTARALRLVVDRPVSHSRLAELWSNPVFARPKERWLSAVLARFGQGFTIGAIGLAAVGAAAWWPDAARAAEVATAVLIIACPCAFTLAAPITLGTAMGVLGRAGLYLKQPAVALDLSRVDTVVFDKTGTLTATTAARPLAAGLEAGDWARVQRLAAHSVHPVSRGVAGEVAAGDGVSAVHEVVAEGITGLVDGHRVVLGSAPFVASMTGHTFQASKVGTWAAVDDRRPGSVQLIVPVRPGAIDAVTAIASRAETWLLSGDHAASAPLWIARFAGRVRFDQTPELKLSVIRDRQAAGRRVLMVGDGLNDAGALAAADVGLAVSDDTACLVPACDAIVRGDRLAKLPVFLAYARRARRVVALCFAVSLFYNAAGLTLALRGDLTPLATAILMPISSLTIVGLSVGLMRWRTRVVLA